MSEVCSGRERKENGRREVRGQSTKTSSQSDACPVIFAAEYERSLEESGEGGKKGLEESGEGRKAGLEKGSWEAEVVVLTGKQFKNDW